MTFALPRLGYSLVSVLFSTNHQVHVAVHLWGLRYLTKWHPTNTSIDNWLSMRGRGARQITTMALSDVSAGRADSFCLQNDPTDPWELLWKSSNILSSFVSKAADRPHRLLPEITGSYSTTTFNYAKKKLDSCEWGGITKTGLFIFFSYSKKEVIIQRNKYDSFIFKCDSFIE